MRSTRAFLIGAGAAYLLDPQQGRRRRHVLRDRTLKLVRRTARQGVRRARFTEGRLHGFAARFRRRHNVPRSLDDETIVQRIRSEALRDARVSTRDVDVEVEKGVATLRGAVGSRTVADDVVSRVAKVPGVRDVAAMLRVSARHAVR